MKTQVKKINAKLFSLIMSVTLIAPTAFAASGSWTNDAAGNWSGAVNWNPNAVPGTAAGDVVSLTNNCPSNQIVRLI